MTWVRQRCWVAFGLLSPLEGDNAVPRRPPGFLASRGHGKQRLRLSEAPKSFAGSSWRALGFAAVTAASLGEDAAAQSASD